MDNFDVLTMLLPLKVLLEKGLYDEARDIIKEVIAEAEMLDD